MMSRQQLGLTKSQQGFMAVLYADSFGFLSAFGGLRKTAFSAIIVKKNVTSNALLVH